MTKSTNLMLSLDEIGLLPTRKPSDIDTRTTINPFIKDSSNTQFNCDTRLPIFVSPMTSVLNKDNAKYFEEKGFTPIIPRIGTFEERLELCETKWVSFSLQEFLNICEKDLASKQEHMYILVDIANGHIGKLYTYARELKQKHPDKVTLMVGNIAHPEMYIECCNAGIDYVRVGIGGGSVCSTSVQCGVHASHVYMIEEINRLRGFGGFHTKVIADGGINTLDRAIKCLALGFDYVMIGKLFAQSAEACGEIRTHIKTHNGEDVYVNYDIINAYKDSKISGDFKEVTLERKYYGMASEQGQVDISGGACKNPEGIETWVKIEYRLEEFKKKFEAALRSTMSYVDAHNLKELQTNTEYAPMSISEFKSYYK